MLSAQFIGRLNVGGFAQYTRVSRLFEVEDLILAESYDQARYAFRIMADGSTSLLSTLPAHLSDTSVLSFSFGGEIRAIPQIYLDALGDEPWSKSLAALGQEQTIVLKSTAGTFLSGQGADGVAVLDQNGTLSWFGFGNSYSSDISAMAFVKADGTDYLVTASSNQGGLSLYDLSGTTPSLVDELGTLEGLPFENTIGFVPLSDGINEPRFLVLDHTGRLTSMVLTSAGTLDVVDHVQDTTLTRFDHATSFDAIPYGDGQLVVVGGGDEGFSLLYVSQRGRIRHLEAYADTQVLQLGTISDLALKMTPAGLMIFIASEETGGLAHIQLDVSNLGMALARDQSELIGTAQNDVLEAGNIDAHLSGQAGHDVLVDGFGNDILVGGAGADVFVLLEDQRTDTIEDFEVGSDVLDLSAWQQLYSLSQINFESTSNGAILRYADETLVVNSASLAPLDVEQITLLTDLDRPPSFVGGPSSQEPVFSTTATARVLEAASVSGLFQGLAGFDRVDYGGAEDGISAFLALPSLNLGAALGDTYQEIEGLTGTSFNDVLYGDGSANLLVGDQGNDFLNAGYGIDTVLGGQGQDILVDPDGGALLEGGSGDDLILALSGTSDAQETRSDDELGGNDILLGGIGEDDLFGGAGSDILVGDFGTARVFGTDTLEGGAGDDFLQGAAGADTFVFRPGDGTDIIADIGLKLSGFQPQGQDFRPGIDTIRLIGFEEILTTSQALSAFSMDVNGQAQFQQEGTTIILFGVSFRELSTDDFWV